MEKTNQTETEMQVYKNPHEAASYIAKRLAFPFWQDRAFDMVRHACTSPSRDGSSPIAMHRVKVDRVAKDWPSAGSISLTRDDGMRFKLVMRGKTFKVEGVL